MYSYFHNAILTKMTTHNQKKKHLAHADLLPYTILLKITKYFMEPGNAIASAGFWNQSAIRVATEETSFLCVSFEQIKLQLF